MGISTEVVLIRDLSDGLLEKRAPAYNTFTHALLFVSCDGKDFWVDPFNPHCKLNQLPWECQGVEGLWLSATGKHNFKPIPMDPPDANCINNICVAQLNESGALSGKLTTAVSGQHLLDLRSSIDVAAEDNLEEELKPILEDVLPATLDYDSLRVVEDESNKLVISLAYSDWEFAETAGDFMNVDFSKWFRGSLSNIFADESRTYDIHFPYLRTDITAVEIAIPEGMAIKELPGDRKIGNEWLSYERSITSVEGTVTFTRTISLKEAMIPAHEYEAVKGAITEIHKLDKETLVLERKQD
jgi:hypothetical protein